MTTLLHKPAPYLQSVIDYYNECWVKRFEEGHNPRSLAIHMGYFEEGIFDNEEAKLNMNKVLAQKLDLRPESDFHLVDAGCGIGGTCFYLAEKFPQLHITALNLSSGQIDVAREFYKKRGLQNSIHFLNEDYCETSLPDSSVNYVYSIEGVCHAEDKLTFYEEAKRILRAGGKLLIFDYVMSGKTLDVMQQKLLDDFQKGWAVKEYISNPEEKLSLAGFTEIRKEVFTSKVLPGIQLSAVKAEQKLSNGTVHLASHEMRRHWQACVALKELALQNIIEYMAITALKPV